MFTKSMLLALGILAFSLTGSNAMNDEERAAAYERAVVNLDTARRAAVGAISGTIVTQLRQALEGDRSGMGQRMVECGATVRYPEPVAPMAGGHAPIQPGCLENGSVVFFRRLCFEADQPYGRGTGGGAVFKLTILNREWKPRDNEYNFTVTAEQVAEDDGNNGFRELDQTRVIPGTHVFYTKWTGEPPRHSLERWFIRDRRSQAFGRTVNIDGQDVWDGTETELLRVTQRRFDMAYAITGRIDQQDLEDSINGIY